MLANPDAAILLFFAYTEKFADNRVVPQFEIFPCHCSAKRSEVAESTRPMDCSGYA